MKKWLVGKKIGQMICFSSNNIQYLRVKIRSLIIYYKYLLYNPLADSQHIPYGGHLDASDGRRDLKSK